MHAITGSFGGLRHRGETARQHRLLEDQELLGIQVGRGGVLQGEERHERYGGGVRRHALGGVIVIEWAIWIAGIKKCHCGI